MRAARSGAPDRRLGRFEKNTGTSFGRAQTPTFPATFHPRARKSPAKKFNTDRVTETDSVAPTRRLFASLFFSRTQISVSPAGAEPPDAQPSTHSSVRAQGTPRSCPNARPSPFSRASPSHALRRPRRGLVRIANHALTRLFVHPSLGFSNAAPLSLRWRPPPPRKTSPPRWSCRTWYAREIFPPFGGSPVRYRDASSRDARPPRGTTRRGRIRQVARPEKPNGERFFSRNRNQRVRVSGVLSLVFKYRV